MRLSSAGGRPRYGPAKGIGNGASSGQTHFGYPPGAARRQAGAGRRRLPQRGAPLRPDERPDVGRPAPRLEGRAGHGGQSAEVRTRRSRCSISPAAPATSPSGWSRPAAPGTRVTVADINADMLAVGRARAAERGLDDAVTFIEANAEALPFPDRSFDAVTIAFGIRNVPRIEVALAEAHRVLQDRRAFPLPGIFVGRCAGPRRALRSLFVQRDPGARPRGDRRRRGLSLSGRIDPPFPAAASLRRHDARRRASRASRSRR